MILILMGVSGTGKTTIGKLLSTHTGRKFEDADDYHSQENRQKMAAGIPLSDADRAPWLTILHERMAQYLSTAAFWPAASTSRTSTPGAVPTIWAK
jgi:gluconokinase